jgi:hypothetical protein
MTSPDTSPDDDLTSWTLGDIKEMGMELEGACTTEGCGEFARFNVDGLIARFGADWRVPKIIPARCSQCGTPLSFQLAVLHDDEPRE